MNDFSLRAVAGLVAGPGRAPEGLSSSLVTGAVLSDEGFRAVARPGIVRLVEAGGVLCAGLVGALCAGALGLWIAGPGTLQALTLPSSLDTDGDGLSDDQEVVAGTNPLEVDTDADTFGDLLEFSLQSDPLSPLSVPGLSRNLSLGLGAYSDGVTVNLTTAVYLPGTHTGGLSLDFGLYFGGVTVPIPYSTLAAVSTVESFPVPGDNALIFKITTPIPDSFLQSLGSCSLFAALAPGNLAPTTSAAVLNFKPMAGVLTTRVATTQGPQGLIYKPITPPATLPSEFEANRICQQMTIVVGQSGATQVLLIESSNCEPAAGYCVPDCSSEVGGTVDILDPLALIGG